MIAVSPALGDLRGYPPVLIISGTADPMIDDNQAFAKKLRDAGNTRVELFVREHMPHGYYFFPKLLKEGDDAFSAIGHFLDRELHTGCSRYFEPVKEAVALSKLAMELASKVGNP